MYKDCRRAAWSLFSLAWLIRGLLTLPSGGSGNSSDRRRLTFREAIDLLEYRYGRPYGIAIFGRLIHAAWWATVGKRRFVATGPSRQDMRKEKKQHRQDRRRHQRQRKHGRE